MKFVFPVLAVQCVVLVAFAMVISGALKEVRQCARLDWVKATLEPRDMVLLQAAKKLKIPVKVEEQKR